MIAWALSVGLPVRCVFLSTTVEDAQLNAVSRMLTTYGRLLEPDEIRQVVKKDVNAFGPGVQFRYQRDLEPPDLLRGFLGRRHRPVRSRDSDSTNRAVVVWCDNVLVRSRAGGRAPLVMECGPAR